MTEIGTVIDGKYEILKEIGRGGMSVVYLAMDKRLNKQWAVKEIRKKGSGKGDEIVVNSLLAEANLMKRLDHPALPRIVDIIDNGITIYVVMDYIEGESLDKILKEYGAQPEETVINWAKQLCDALGYLHSQKPPIIYRDMKPANVMLKPEGNIKIIDFGIAREYKELSLADTTVLGTKGYAPPEQYSGQTDPRSDIYALGMTMHHLLTGVDPRNGEVYAPVRQWNPELSEGIELIIDKCVEPAAENRYQSTADLLYDLENPDLITRGYKQKQKRRLGVFIAALSLSVVMVIAGLGFNIGAKANKDHNFTAEMNGNNFYGAIDIKPDEIEPYRKIIESYQLSGASDAELKKIEDKVDEGNLDIGNPDVAKLYYDIGRLQLAYGSGTFEANGNIAINYFKKAVDSSASFQQKAMAESYYSLLSTKGTKTAGLSVTQYEEIFAQIEKSVNNVLPDLAYDNTKFDEASFDKALFCYAALNYINSQVEYMQGAGVSLDRVEQMLKLINDSSASITSKHPSVVNFTEKTSANYDTYLSLAQSTYNNPHNKGGN